MKLPKKLLNLIYQMSLDEVWRSDIEERPAGYKEDLCKLIEILEKEVDKGREYTNLKIEDINL